MKHKTKLMIQNSLKNFRRKIFRIRTRKRGEGEEEEKLIKKKKLQKIF